MPKISVVVPVYKVEEYLSHTLDSVLKQTMQDFEVICVNDGSPDHSAKILQAYALLDERVRVVNKANGGLSSARNAGVKVARGDYIVFLDSDDFLAPQALECIASEMGSHNLDLVTFGGYPYPKVYSYDWIKKTLNPKPRFYESFNPEVLFRRGSMPFVWRMAVSRTFVNEADLSFVEDLPFGEDMVYMMQAYPRAKRMKLIANKLIYYRLVRPGSLMFDRSTTIFKRNQEHIAMTELIMKDWHAQGFTKSYGLSLARWAGNFLFGDLLCSLPEEREVLRQKIVDVFKRYLSDEDIALLYKDAALGATAQAIFEHPERMQGWSKRFMMAGLVIHLDGLRFFVSRSLRFAKNLLLRPVNPRAIERVMREESLHLDPKAYRAEKADYEKRLSCYMALLSRLRALGSDEACQLADSLEAKLSFGPLPPIATRTYKQDLKARIKEESQRMSKGV